MNLRVITLKGVAFEGEVTSLNAKTAAGEITVLDHHRPLISVLRKGKLRLVLPSGEQQVIPAKSGFLEVRPGNETTVLAH